LCGHDPETDDAIAAAIVEAEEIDAAAEVAAAEEYAEIREEDREHVETLTEIQESAETERTEILAAAAVEIATAQAEAAVAIAQPADVDEDQDDEHDEEDEVAEESGDAGEVTPVDVPPQIDDEEPAQRSEPNAGPVRRRRGGPTFGRRARR
jgi:hypothetical protein